MKLKWPPMVTIRPDQDTVYQTPGQRLYWAEQELSIVVPPACSAKAGRGYCRIGSEPSALQALLMLHNSSDTLVSYWLDEEFEDEGEELKPVEPRQTRLDVLSRRFASGSRVAYKVKVDDEVGNGISAFFTAPASRAGDLSMLLAQVVDSVRFVQFHPLAGHHLTKAVHAFVNSRPETSDDLFLYLDRRFYMMQDEAMDPVRLLTEDFEKEGRPGAQWLAEMWRFLKMARQLVDDGKWDQTIAELRRARP